MTTRISIVNAYGDENRGSAALNIAAVKILRESFSDSRIGLVTINEFSPADRKHKYRHTLSEFPDVEVLPPLVKDLSLKFGAASSLPIDLANGVIPGSLCDETRRFIMDCDLVVSRGGVVYTGADSFGRTAALFRRSAALRFAQSRGIPTVLLGLHAGSVSGRLGEWSVRRQFERASLVLPRGPFSRDVVSSIAPSARSHNFPDSVFASGLRLTKRDEQLASTIVVSLSDPAESLAKDVANLVTQLINDGAASGAIVVVQVDGSDSDARASGELRRLLPVGTPLIGDDLSPQELVDLYGSCLAVISNRLHATIFGLLGGTPSFPLDTSVDRKATDTFVEVGLENLVLSPDAVSTWLDTVKRGIAQGREPIGEATERATDRYTELVPMLRELIADGG